MCSKLFQTLVSDNIVFVPFDLISTFLCFCNVRKNCYPSGGAIEPGGQWFYIG